MISLLMAITTIVGTPPAILKANCPIAEAHFTSGTIDGSSAKGFRTLDREPPAQAYLTVARKIDNCTVPMIVPSMLTRGR